MTDPILERDPRLALVVQRLVTAYQPESIYLFGSVARGDADTESDYDLLIVVRQRATSRSKPSLTENRLVAAK